MHINRCVWAAAAALVGVVTVLVSAPARLSAQSGVALSGVVSSDKEGKMEGVVVSARREGANYTVSVITGSGGKYSFPTSHVGPGKYAVTTRATGYEQPEAASADVLMGKAAKVDVKLVEAQDISKHLTSREWALSLPEKNDMLEKAVFNIESCVYCHSLERIFRTKYTAEQLVPAITRMLKYYPDGSVMGTAGRGRTVMKTKEEQERAEKSPNWWEYSPSGGPIPKKELAEFIAKYNLSGGRTKYPYDFVRLPRAKGTGGKTIVTTWDLPRKDTVPHDSQTDSKGNLWYTDESAMWIGKLNPKTNEITEYQMPPVEKGDIPGVRDITIDGQDNLWFTMRLPGSKSVLHKWEPATQKLTQIEGTAGQFVAVSKDGKKVWVGFQRADTTTAKLDGDFRRPANLPQGKNMGAYGLDIDPKGNPWGTSFMTGEIMGVDVAKGEALIYPVAGGTNAVPRRGRVDAKGRFWFSFYGKEALGMFDTNTRTFKEWKIGPRFSTPYTSSTPDPKERVYLPSNTCDCFFRVDTKSGQVLEFAMPAPVNSFDAKRVSWDPTSKVPALMFANTRNAQLVRMEVLD
jgi:virginiamycin B lyase